jgi:hypothetical protein
MLKTLLAGAAALTLMSGAGFAQTSYTGSTTETTTVAPVQPRSEVTTTMRRTEDRNGVTIEKSETGSDVAPVPLAPVPLATTSTKTQTTTTHQE